jgi:polysaccharide export outer membrane protein
MACCCEHDRYSRILGDSLRRLLLAMGLLLGSFMLTGCKSAHFSSTTMPPALRVPPANRVNHMDVAGMVAPGTGTNEIGPGDLLGVTLDSGRNTEEEKKPFQVRVSPEGTVDAAPIGPVLVAGLEPSVAEQRIAQAAIERGIFVRPTVTLQVLKPAVNRITVLGAVTEPGVKELPKGSSDLARALAAAGGLTDEASTKVDVLRYSTQTFMAGATAKPQADGVTLASYNAGGGAAGGAMNPPQTTRIDLAQAPANNQPNYALGDRDVVMVLPQDKQFIHVTGLVRLPNQFEIPRHQDITVMDAIALAGGVSSPVADKVFIIRRLPDMPEPAIIEVSIKEANRDGHENLRLAAGDLVSIERTPSTVIVDSVMTMFRVGFSVGGNLVAF